MHVHVSIRPHQLLAQYQHTHLGHEPLFLFNHPHDWYGILSGDIKKGSIHNPNQPPTSALAAVIPCDPEGVVLEQRLPGAPPPPIQPYAPFQYLCQRLVPGETVTVTMALPLPLHAWRPYFPPEPPYVETWVRTLTMKVEAIAASNANYCKAHPTWPHLYQVTGHPTQMLSATVALDTPIVLRRSASSRTKVPVCT